MDNKWCFEADSCQLQTACYSLIPFVLCSKLLSFSVFFNIVHILKKKKKRLPVLFFFFFFFSWFYQENRVSPLVIFFLVFVGLSLWLSTGRYIFPVLSSISSSMRGVQNLFASQGSCWSWGKSCLSAWPMATTWNCQLHFFNQGWANSSSEVLCVAP